MLDLSLNNNLYQCKWIDGSVITLKAPTQAVYKELLAVQNASDDEAIEQIFGLTEKILKNNINNKRLDTSALGVEACVILLQDYFAFYEKELSKVVFQQSL